MVHVCLLQELRFQHLTLWYYLLKLHSAKTSDSGRDPIQPLTRHCEVKLLHNVT